MDAMLDMAVTGCEQLAAIQAEVLAAPYPGVLPEPPAPAGRKRG